MKIALVAMSGIRVCDQELLNLGLTLPGFVERSKVIASLPSLGLLTLAGMTPARHEVCYVEVADLPVDASSRSVLDSSQLVAISSFSAQMKQAYQLADSLRSKGIRVVLGGLHASCLPEEAKTHCDAVVIGEGEVSWQKLLQDAEQGRLQPFYGGRETQFDLADAPMPAFELLDIKKYNRLTVQTSRGCPHRCEFCASSVLLTSRYKQKPANKVLAEIDRICDIWMHPFIEFADDNTFVNKSYWKQLLPELAKRKIRWFTETDISIAQDRDLLRLMRTAGCAQVLIGLESASIEGLNGIESKCNWKAGQWPNYRQAITAIQSEGISVNGCFILGLDEQDPGIFERVFDFVESSHLHEVQITLQTAFPGTPLYERLAAEDRLIDAAAWEKCTLFDINYHPKRMTVAELSKGFRELSMKLYSEEFTHQRRQHFKATLRETVRSEKKER
jgi:radical SAM superfamily enzyme YgiQ (UPF0313 family)